MKALFIAMAIFMTLSSMVGCSRRVIGPPPPPRVEIIPVRPSPRHIWVNGHYYQRRNHYYWSPGHYEVRHRRYR